MSVILDIEAEAAQRVSMKPGLLQLLAYLKENKVSAFARMVVLDKRDGLKEETGSRAIAKGAVARHSECRGPGAAGAQGGRMLGQYGSAPAPGYVC